MQTPDTTDAPIVPYVNTDAGSGTETATSDALASDGGRRPPARPFDRPPRTDYANEYTRDEAEIEPLVPDLR